MIRGPRPRRRRRIPTQLALAGTLAVGTLIGLTASNIVPASRAGDDSRQATADDVKPTDCAAISLVNTVTGAGTFSATGQADLVTGSPGVDSIRGLQRDDCILGGGGNDFLRGDAGLDVCIGGPGTDTFDNTCEVQIQ